MRTGYPFSLDAGIYCSSCNRDVTNDPHGLNCSAAVVATIRLNQTEFRLGTDYVLATQAVNERRRWWMRPGLMRLVCSGCERPIPESERIALDYDPTPCPECHSTLRRWQIERVGWLRFARLLWRKWRKRK